MDILPWEDLDAMQRGALVLRMTKSIRDKLTFSEIGQIYEVLRVNRFTRSTGVPVPTLI